jgi:iron transport multicopper oxidase
MYASMRLTLASALLAISNSALGSTVSYRLTVGNANLAPDGFNRSTTVVNGQYPGPLITANKGDVIMVNVTNSLADPNMHRTTSIVSSP